MRLKAVLSSDFMLVLSSLLIAFVIWLIAKYGEIETDTLNVPVNLVNIADNSDVKLLTRDASITVQYPKSLKSYIVPANFRIVKDANSINPGISKYEKLYLPISVDDVVTINLPQSVKAIGIGEPKQIALEAKYYSEMAKIAPKIKGIPQQNYVVVSPAQAKPDQVLVTGAPEFLKKLKESSGGQITLPTEEVNVEGKKESFPQTVRVLLPEGLKLLREEDSLVEVIVGITEKTTRKTIRDIPLSLPTFLENVRTETNPSRVSVTVEAPMSLVDKIDKDSFVFNTKQPLEEVPGAVGRFAIEAKFSDSTDREVRERATIISVEPDKVEIRFLEKAASAPTEKAP
jgi:hypothetical protein